MRLGGDYPRPVFVNGYSCRNCDEVSLAKRGLDPRTPEGAGADAAVRFGGALESRAAAGNVPAPPRLLDRLV